MDISFRALFSLICNRVELLYKGMFDVDCTLQCKNIFKSLLNYLLEKEIKKQKKQLDKQPERIKAAKRIPQSFTIAGKLWQKLNMQWKNSWNPSKREGRKNLVQRHCDAV